MSSVESRQEKLRTERAHATELAADTWEQPPDVPDDPLGQIAYWQERERLANAEVVAAVDAARAAGAKWWEIGAAMGRTAEAARAFRHYHRQSEESDS